MSALENIRKGLSSSGSTLIVGILIVGLVATFGNFLGTDNAFNNQKVLEINGNPNWHVKSDSKMMKEIKKYTFDEILKILSMRFYHKYYDLDYWEQIE